MNNNDDVLRIIGGKPTAPRAELDYYTTDPIAVDKLLQHYTLPHNVWECACGNGNISKRLEEKGYSVYSSDVKDRGFGVVRDFFTAVSMPEGCTAIVTNPPYCSATEFVRHSLALIPKDNGVVAMFLKMQFLETQRRYNEIFRHHPPEFMFQFINRVRCYKNNEPTEGNSAMAFCWLIWDNAERYRRHEKGIPITTQIYWI